MNITKKIAKVEDKKKLLAFQLECCFKMNENQSNIFLLFV